jgi:hypothetical protein
LKQDLRPLVQERITSSVYSRLTPQQQEKVTDLLENNKIQELKHYLEEKIPNYYEKIMEIYADFEDEYLENMES